MRGLIVGLIAGSAVSVAAAPVVPAVATVTASAEEPANPAWGALARDDSVQWCVPNGAGASLTVTFDRPIAVGNVMVITDYEQKGYTGPERFEIISDSGAFAGKLEHALDKTEVTLDARPTKRLTLKVSELEPSNTTRMCVRELAFADAQRENLPVIVGVTAAAAAAVPAFVRDAGAALHTCDADKLAATFQFPISIAKHLERAPSDMQAPKPELSKFSSARALAAACAADGGLIALGAAVDVDDFVATLTPGRPGTAHLGEDTFGRNIVWNNGWKVAGVDIVSPTSSFAGWGEPGPVDRWMGQTGTPTAPDAMLVVVDRKSTLVSRDRLAALFDDAMTAEPELENATGVRDGDGRWMTMVLVTEKHTIRVTALAADTASGSAVIAAFVSSAHTGKASAMAPLPPLTRDRTLIANPELVAAVDALFTGKIDKLAMSRDDLLAFGTGPKDVIWGGAKVAAWWKAGWANKLTIGGVVGRVAPSGRTAFVVVDATKGRTAYRIAIVLDKTATGAWSLGHLHIATP